MVTLAQILETEGIVIRKIPAVTVSHWLSIDSAVERHKARGGETYFNERGREVMVERKTNSLGGKYLVMFCLDQTSQVHFYKGRYGVGDTIEAAYADYFDKTEKKESKS